MFNFSKTFRVLFDKMFLVYRIKVFLYYKNFYINRKKYHNIYLIYYTPPLSN